ncbi:hypothetical protein L218DRAFT_962231 [Marasmius fiardii PR-910]|nr:hypothetical protein L218DRAFT_962231 [Marasmius fiardii PR-910]
MKMFLKATILASLASFAFATVFITSPIDGTVFTGGQKATIRWQDSPDKPSLADWGNSKVSIYTGNAIQQSSLQQIAASVDVSKVNTVEFTVDPSIGPNGKFYFIRVESLALKDSKSPQYPALAFSAKFELNGMSGKFSAAVQAQVDGEQANPIGGGSSGSSSSSSSAKPTSTTSSSSSSTSAPSRANNAAASSTQSNAAGRISSTSRFNSAWVGVLGGIAAGALLL